MDQIDYEVVVVGGGPAGLSTALYTTRLGHRTAVFEKEGGRHAAVTHVHNVLGVSEEVSGRELAEQGVRQLETYGADVYPDAVEAVRRHDDGFRIEAAHATVDADRVALATGFRDRPPRVPELQEFTGHGLYYCLHCDAYTLGDAPAFVLGHGKRAALLAMKLLNFTADVDLLLDGREPEWDEDLGRRLRAHPVDRVEAAVVSADAVEGGGGKRGIAEDEGDSPARLRGLSFDDGTEREYRGGFAAYGREYNSGLAADLGCELNDDGSIAVDERRETSVDGVYAVGDVTHGRNQTPIAIGDGAHAGIALHEDLRRYPLSVEDVEERLDAEDVEDGAFDVEVPGAADDLRARMRLVRSRETMPGLGAEASNR